MKFNTEDGEIVLVVDHRTPNNFPVVEQANDTSYGLAVSVSTEDIDRAIRVAHTLEAGIA
jgi:acyl-CoA reductase-like NAD-dependent aldehyde dehydrogenase